MTGLFLPMLVGAIVGAAGFRLRGSKQWALWTGGGIGTARLFAWALPVALTAWLMLPLEWWEALLLWVALWAGALTAWWGSLDLGRMEGTWARDFGLHTLRGLVWVIPPAVALLLAHEPIWWAPLIAGACCGLVYEIGWQLQPRWAIETGEVLFGGLVGAAVMAAGGGL